jgi:hypothetical protein
LAANQIRTVTPRTSSAQPDRKPEEFYWGMRRKRQEMRWLRPSCHHVPVQRMARAGGGTSRCEGCKVCVAHPAGASALRNTAANGSVLHLLCPWSMPTSQGGPGRSNGSETTGRSWPRPGADLVPTAPHWLTGDQPLSGATWPWRSRSRPQGDTTWAGGGCATLSHSLYVIINKHDLNGGVKPSKSFASGALPGHRDCPRQLPRRWRSRLVGPSCSKRF